MLLNMVKSSYFKFTFAPFGGYLYIEGHDYEKRSNVKKKPVLSYFGKKLVIYICDEKKKRDVK